MKIAIGKYGDAYIEYLDSRFANKTEESRIKWTTELAAISRGNDKSNNPTKRYAALMEEAEGGKPSRPMEFMPIVITEKNSKTFDIKEDEKIVRMLRYSYTDDEEQTVCTTMRATVELGVDYTKIPYNDVVEHFAAFRIKAPMFVWAQIVTHTQLSTESQSDRVAEQVDYWLPEDIEEKLTKLNTDSEYMNSIIEKVREIDIQLSDDISSGNIPDNADGFISYMIETASQKDIQLLLKVIGYPREIYSRAPYYFKMKEFVITGWVNDDDAWPHFLRERNAYMYDGGPKNWTQPETRKYSFAMRKLLEEHQSLSRENVLGIKK